jgi:heat shock protein HslJ
MQVVALMVVGAAVVVGCGGSTDAQVTVGARQSATEKRQAATRQLWGRGFVATSVKGRGGKQPPIAQPGDIQVSFSKGHGRWIGWEANCNGYGANVRIGAGRLKLTRIVGTAVGCSPVLAREDSWLLHFFEADPKWRWRGTHLTLTSGGKVMELEESKG